MTDSYRRREIEPGVYQCGCHWKRDGDRLVECGFHAQAASASVAGFSRIREEQ